jgi:CheY-like chemotaxis protein
MTKMLQRILGEDIALQAEYAPNLPPVRADVGMLEQVLLNLAVNSRDAMPRGGRLAISTRAQTFSNDDAAHNADMAPGLHVCLGVSDTGSGIAPEVLPRIFEPFFTTKEVGKGTGLGLATVHGIVKQHHGWIEVASEAGRGTAFQIYLPAMTDGRRVAESAPADTLPRGTETILVVEDESAVRLLVVHLLERCGYSVLQTESGVEALEIWKTHRDEVDLLLTDLVMPGGISGRELAARLLAEKPRLKVVYTSGYSADVAGKAVTLVEGSNFLQKPYQPFKLAQTVRACLDQR